MASTTQSGMKKTASLDSSTMFPREIFSHHGVCYVPPGCREDDVQQYNGTLSILAHGFTRYIEWKPIEIPTVNESQEQEWAVVNTSLTNLANGVGDSQQRSLTLRLTLSDLKCYRVSNKKTKLTFTHKDRKTQRVFFFQYENADCFTRSLSAVVKTRRSRRDKHTYNIIEERIVPETVSHSFSELNLFNDQRESVWKFVSDLKTRPYETTMSTFSKVSEYLLYKNPENRPIDEVVNAFLSGGGGTASNSGPPSTSQVGQGETSIIPLGPDSLQDYHVVGRRDQLPTRELMPRKQPLSSEQWAKAFDSEGRAIDVSNVKRIIFDGGVSESQRYDVWKFLLGYFPWNSTSVERQELRQKKVEEYFSMKMQWKTISATQEARFSEFRDRKSLIEKDVSRTDRTIPFFSGDDNPNLSLLYDILMTYVMYNFDLGYVQGMSDLLSPILYVMPNEVDAFWCFVGFMDKVFRNFDMDQSGMKKQLSQLHTLLTAVEPNLATYLDENDSGNMFFCFRWLLVWFKREFSLEDVMSLWEVLWTGLPCTNFHLLISVAILEAEKDVIMSNHFGFSEILKHVNDLSTRLNLNDLLVKATAIYRQLESATNLTTSTRRVLGLTGGDESHSQFSSTSDDDNSFGDDDTSPPCDLASPRTSRESDELDKGCSEGMSNHFL